ncbi:hypothetical protein [Chromobacterium vaccinii]|uniref:Uncharacterized protein n=1 Tax=Chromobacterium vaccinii TaxID=1108595 RepID=A0A1D9LC15_9NEIS|nr:hypothetical protein [Chromobacterium vaccinii]AOZ48826.1 hypothetical protein BKX93_01660 [Chromobacterium vaccinii]
MTQHITARVQFDSATAEERIKSLVAEYDGQSISPHRMEVIQRRAVDIAMECMDVKIVPELRREARGAPTLQ